MRVFTHIIWPSIVFSSSPNFKHLFFTIPSSEPVKMAPSFPQDDNWSATKPSQGFAAPPGNYVYVVSSLV